MFPEYTPLLMTTTVLIFRTLYITNPKNWWMVHPDEVYQSVEVAHIHLYGYGFRSYEFSSRDETQNVSENKELELDANMYDLMSPLYPYFYVLVGWLAWLSGCQYNPYILWRIAHVFVSSTLPLALHLYVCRLHKSRKAACMAAIMSAASLHMNVLGTHCLVQSFFAPITLYSMALVAKSSNPKGSESASGKNATDELKPIRNKLAKNGSMNLSSSHKKVPVTSQKEILKTANGMSEIASGTRLTNASESSDNNKIRVKGLIAGVQWQIFISGFLMFLISYIRPATMLVYLLHFLLFDKIRCIVFGRKLIPFSSGAFCALVVSIGVDFNYYGFGVISPWTWLRYTFSTDLSTFGFSWDASSYWNEVTSIHGIGFLLAMAFLFETALFLHEAQSANSNNKNTPSVDDANRPTKSTRQAGINRKNIAERKNPNVIGTDIPRTKRFVTSYRSFLVWIFLLTIYLMYGPKELRFIHDVFVFIFVYVSITFIKVKRLLRNDTLRVNALRIVLVIFAVNQWIMFPSSDTNGRWVFQRAKDVHDVNACLHYMAKQQDVTGVFCGSDLSMTGGMTLLHHEVTIMSFLNDGFYEYGPTSRRNLTSRALLTDRQAWVFEFSQASNYVDGHNALAVARIIIQNTLYNYVIVSQEAQFLPFGFDEVLSKGNWRVLKRSLDAKSEQMLQSLLERIPIGANATGLLHEGHVLRAMHQYTEAIVRFQHALHLNASLLEAYVYLQSCYHTLGDQDSAKDVKDKCLRVFSERKCNTATEKRKLSPMPFRY